MNLIDKRSKLVVIIGFFSDNYNIMCFLIEVGVICIRVNFSYGSYEEYLNKFKIVKKIFEDMYLFVLLILDIKGLEIRVGKMKGGV